MSMTPKQLGKYELQQRLGHGGAAEVWKALDTQLQRYVAIKILHPDLRDDPSFVNRFRREAQLIAALHHPNIVQIHDFQIFQPADEEHHEQSSIAYMVMDYVEGQTLADYIHATSSRGQFPTSEELVNLFTSISLAIDYAHQQGMIHRDIKPANILLDQRSSTQSHTGEPILTDFGVAKLMGVSTNSVTGTQIGTPLYISPEQAKGYPGNERSDLYSLGVILYELTTGVTPFRGDTTLDVITQHINATPTAPELINPQIQPTLALVIMRSIAKNPIARFPSAASMTAAIAEALHIPIPEALGQPAYPPAPVDMPTRLTPWLSSPLLPPLTPRNTPSGASQTPVWTARQGPISMNGQSNAANVTPMLHSNSLPPASQPGIPQTQHTYPNYPPPFPYPAAPAPPTPPIAKRRWTWLYFLLIPLLIIMIAAGALGTYVLLKNRTTTTPTIVANNTTTGHAFYVSSGQLVNGTARGIADRMQIDLQNIPAPQAGKSYYAWLLPDKQPNTGKDLTGPRPITPPLLLTNNLPVTNQQVHFMYGGDGQNNNLLSTTSRILITEEDANRTPAAPSTDQATWRYYGEIPQAQIPGDAHGFSALIHIRHLFYNETNITILGLPGGLDSWMLKNTEKVLEWSISAQDTWQGTATDAGLLNQIRQQFIRILDYLDGSLNVHVDMPSGTPLLVDATSGKVALLTVDPQHQITANYDVNPPGYVDHVQLHVGQIARATDISVDMRQRTARILDEVKRAKNWLLAVHDDAAKLFQLSNNLNQFQQQSTGTLLDALATHATYAYIGQLDPTTNTVQPAIIQAHYDIQQLATLTISKDLPKSLN